MMFQQKKQSLGLDKQNFIGYDKLQKRTELKKIIELKELRMMILMMMMIMVRYFPIHDIL